MSDDAAENAKNVNLIEKSIIWSNADQGEGRAVIAGRLDPDNAWVLCLLAVSTFCLYFCFRKKLIGGIVVTPRRVIHVCLEVDTLGTVTSFTQANFFIRHFASSKHYYDQPKYSCMDKILCVPIMHMICCIKPKPFIKLEMTFVQFPGSSALGVNADAANICVTILVSLMKPCLTLFSQACNDGAAGVQLGTAGLSMEVGYADGLRKVNEVLAAAMHYHPSKHTNFGKPWDSTRGNNSHPRLVNATPERRGNELVETYTPTLADQRVPVNFETFGFVIQEEIYDGLAAKVRFCTLPVCLASITIFGFIICYINFMYCAPIRREFYVLTDRRLLRLVLFTEGFKNLPRLSADSDGKTRFQIEFTTWMMTAIGTFRMSADKHWCAQFGPECLCCSETEYSAAAYTALGGIYFYSSGKENLREFLNSFMNQHYDKPFPVNDVQVPASKRYINAGAESIADVDQGDAEDHTKVLAPHPVNHAVTLIQTEQPLAHIQGRIYSFCDRVCAIPLLIASCGFFPRYHSSHLFLTTQRLITSNTHSVPCWGKKNMTTHVEYYTLRQVKRVMLTKSYSCSCCVFFVCCPKTGISISTDGLFEASPSGEESYEVISVSGVRNAIPADIQGNEAESLAHRAKEFVSLFSLLYVNESWMFEKKILSDPNVMSVLDPEAPHGRL